MMESVGSLKDVLVHATGVVCGSARVSEHFGANRRHDATPYDWTCEDG